MWITKRVPIKIFSLIFGTFLYFLSVSKIQAASYYVAKDGNDTNPGALSQPWKTIQHASSTLVAGDTVYIRGGTYDEQVIPQKSGSASGGYITYAAYPGETVIINGDTLSLGTWDGLVWLKAYYVGNTKVRMSYIKISGLNVKNAKGGGDTFGGYDVHGIKVEDSDNIIIEKNSTYNTISSGIGVWGSTNVVVDGNDIALACNIGPEENLSVDNSSYVEVKNNLVHKASNIADGYSGGEGINVKNGSHDIQIHHNIVHLDERPDGKPSNRLAFGLDAWEKETYNVSFYDNIAYNNGTGFIVESENGGLARDISVYNNIAYNNRGPGFYMPNWEQKTAIKKNIQFYNNTSYQNGYGFFVNVANIDNVVFKNNIVSGNDTNVSIIPVSAEKVAVDNNLFFGSGGTYGTNIKTGDPKFVNPALANFHLISDSPAIDTGIVTGINTDFDGVTRPQGAGYDIGAYEYIFPVVSPSPTPTPIAKLGDANADNNVDDLDYAVWSNNYGQSMTGPSKGDFNADGIVNGVDYVIWINNYGK